MIMIDLLLLNADPAFLWLLLIQKYVGEVCRRTHMYI